MKEGLNLHAAVKISRDVMMLILREFLFQALELISRENEDSVLLNLEIFRYLRKKTIYCALEDTIPINRNND